MVGSAGPPREHPCYDSVRRRPSAGEQVDEVLGAAPRWHGCPYERGHQCDLSSLVRSRLGTRLQPPEPRGTAVCHLRCPSTVFHCSPELTKTATPCFRVRAAQEGRPPRLPRANGMEDHKSSAGPSGHFRQLGHGCQTFPRCCPATALFLSM